MVAVKTNASNIFDFERDFMHYSFEEFEADERESHTKTRAKTLVPPQNVSWRYRSLRPCLLNKPSNLAMQLFRKSLLREECRLHRNACRRSAFRSAVFL